jgi:hypothetical protein
VLKYVDGSAALFGDGKPDPMAIPLIKTASI